MTIGELREHIWGVDENPVWVVDKNGEKHSITGLFEVEKSTDATYENGVYLRIEKERKEEPSAYMTFVEAFEAMKRGLRVYREDWVSPTKYIYMRGGCFWYPRNSDQGYYWLLPKDIMSRKWRIWEETEK